MRKTPWGGSRTTRCTTRRRGAFSSGWPASRACAGKAPRSCSRILRRAVADLLTVRDLTVHLAVDAGTVRARGGLSVRVPEGGTVALVGESGSGTSVVAQSIMGILPRIARIVGGEILFRDPQPDAAPVDIARLAPASRAMQHLRGA